MKKGLFITFEGPEGSGKSTHSKLLCGFLKKKHIRMLYTREPGGTAISEKIREILLDPANKDMVVACEMLLYMAARAQIIEEKIMPALEKGAVVVCDRFIDATMAYQGYAGGIDLNIINNIGALATKGARPDLTFLLDIAPEEGLLRSGRIKDRMEKKSLSFHRRVRKGYLDIARKDPARIKVMSAVGDIDKNQEKIRKIVEKMMGTGLPSFLEQY